MEKPSTSNPPAISNLIDLDSSIGFHASILTARLRKTLLEILGYSELLVNPDELGILTLLYNGDPMNMSELAETLMKDNANMTRLVKGLEEKSFVGRERDESDRRMNRVILTKLGEEQVKRAWMLLDQLTEHATHNLSQQEQDRACETLKVISENIKQFSVKLNGK